MVRSHKLTAHIALLFAVLAWGIEYVLIKASTQSQSPLVVGLGTFVVAAVLFGLRLGLRAARGHEAVFAPGIGNEAAAEERMVPPAIRVPWRLLLVIGIIGSAINILLIYGQKLTTTASASALGRTDILFTILLAALIFGERIRRIHLFVLPVMLAGIYLVTGIRITALDFGSTGDYLILGSTFLLSLNAFVIKRAARRLDSFFIAFVNTTINALVFLALILVSGTWSALVAVPASSWLLIGAIGVCGFVFMGGYYIGLHRLPVLEVRLLLLLVPVVTVLAGWVALGSLPTVRESTGMPLIIMGAAALVLRDHLESRRATHRHTRKGDHGVGKEEPARYSH
jgi:drug/metabolite transporter (DMT)-like permease